MSKRGRGEGSLEQLPSGKWRAIYTNGKKPDGSQRKVSATFDLRRDAAAWLNEQLAMKRRDPLCQPSQMFLAVWLRQWLSSLKGGKARSTFRNRTNSIELILSEESGLGDVELAQLTPFLIDQAFGRLAESGYSSVQRLMAAQALRSAIDAAVRLKLLYGNPAKELPLPKTQEREMKCWSLSEARSFLGLSSLANLHALFALALDSGMRQGEILGLHWPDIDLVEGAVTVSRSLEEVDGDFALNPPKSKKGRRCIWIGEATVAALSEHRERMRLKGHDVVRGIVFVNCRRSYLHKTNVRRVFKKIVAAAGLPYIRLHDLRHTCATLLLQAGVGIKTVSERLGHASVNITLGTYAHVLPGEQKAVGAVAGRLFGQLPTDIPPEKSGEQNSSSEQQPQAFEVKAVETCQSGWPFVF